MDVYNWNTVRVELSEIRKPLPQPFRIPTENPGLITPGLILVIGSVVSWTGVRPKLESMQPKSTPWTARVHPLTVSLDWDAIKTMDPLYYNWLTTKDIYWLVIETGKTEQGFYLDLIPFLPEHFEDWRYTLDI